MKFFAVIFGAFLFGIGVSFAAEETVTLGGLSVTVWSQDSPSSAKKPVLIFSHGFHGCATQSRFLMEAFASAGYFVVAPNHRDATCHGGKGSWFDMPAVPFRKAGAWNDRSFVDRADDIRRLIEGLKTDSAFGERIDMSRLGLVGHSLGGYTVLGLTGAWQSWKLPGVKATLALSPYTQPFVVKRTLAGVSVPVMYQTGTWDFTIAPALREPGGAYDQTPSPKYYVEFDRAGHFAWTDLRGTAHDQIVSYSVAFMNHFVRAEKVSDSLSWPQKGVAQFRYTSEQK